MNEEDYKWVRVKYTAIIFLIFVTTCASVIVLDKLEEVSMSRPSSWYLYCTKDSCSCNFYGSVPIRDVVACTSFVEEFNRQLQGECIMVGYSDDTIGCIKDTQLVANPRPPIITEITAVIE